MIDEKKCRYNLRIPFIISMILVIGTGLLGPYIYQALTWWGVAYYLLCTSLFFIGLSMIKVGVIRRYANSRILELDFMSNRDIIGIKLSRKGERFLVAISVITILATVIYVVTIIRQADGVLSIAGGDFRYLVTDVRSNRTRLLELLMWFGTPTYLLSTNSINGLSKKKMVIINIAFWIVPVFYLILGARFSVFYHIIVFLVNNNHTKANTKTRTFTIRINTKNNMSMFVIIIGIMAMLLVVLKLFSVRGLQTADTLNLHKDGDMTMRTLWAVLYQLSGGVLNPIYKVIHYFAHSVPNLCYMLSNYTGNYIHLFGLSNFVVIRYVLIAAGFSDDWAKIATASYPGYGAYKTFISSSIIDWGVCITPIMCLVLGYIFSRIEKLAKNGHILAKSMYPICWACMINSSIIGIWVASSQMNLIIMVIIYVCLKYCGGFVDPPNYYLADKSRKEIACDLQA